MFWQLAPAEIKTAPAKRKPETNSGAASPHKSVPSARNPGNGLLVDAAVNPTSWSDAETVTPR
jgi:hypothetical protein